MLKKSVSCNRVYVLTEYVIMKFYCIHTDRWTALHERPKTRDLRQVSRVIWDHTVLPATCDERFETSVTSHMGSHSVTGHPTQVNVPRPVAVGRHFSRCSFDDHTWLASDQASWYSVNLVDLGGWLHTKKVYLQIVTHPCINQGEQRTTTSLIKTNALATTPHHR